MKTLQALIVFVVGISSILLLVTSAGASDQAEAGVESCLLRFTTFQGPSHLLTEEERQLTEGLAERGETLARGVLRVEEILQRADYVPSDLPEQGLAWVAVLTNDVYQLGVYRVNEDNLERLALLADGDTPDLSARFALAEQALANTPLDCSRSFGVLDQNLDSANGGRALYAIQLVDRSKELAWGMHYRFEVLDGELQRLDRLHVRCSIMSVVPRMAIDDSARRGRAPFSSKVCRA